MMTARPETVVTLDFETYYDSEYSLSNMTTAQYIFDPRFEALMVAIKRNDEPVYHAEGRQIHHALKDAVEGADLVVAHNMMFDGSILAWKYGLQPKQMFCTWMAGNATVSAYTKTSLAALGEFFGVGTKGTEVVNAKGKRRKDFDDDDWAAYVRYCKNDVQMTYNLYCIFRDWYARNHTAIA